jgi:hypothetical protein
MAGNPTRLLGYFYDAFHANKANWDTFHFRSDESLVVNDKFVKEIIEQYGQDSDQYRVRVIGEFPRADAVDEKGYVPLLVREDLKHIGDASFVGTVALGVDPSGEGDDDTVWVLRDSLKAKVVLVEKISSPVSMAQKTLSLMEYYNVKPENVVVDNFGVGANVAQELAMAGKRVRAINVGDSVNDKERLNLRAKLYWDVKQWLRRGGELIKHKGWEELLQIRYRPELNGKLRIMSKREMQKLGIKSPNIADALMLSMHVDLSRESVSNEDVEESRARWRNPAMSGVSSRRSWG